MTIRPTGLHLPALAAALLLSGLLAPAARAGLDIDLGASVQLGDDADVYVAVSARYFDHDEGQIRAWNHRCDDPDDLAVALFIARHGRAAPDDVFALRASGLGWWEIAVRCDVPAELWFPAVKRDPGPPYGKAYGHWKNRGRGSSERLALSDDDARNLVAVRLLHEYYGVSVEVAMDWRSSGQDLSRIAASEYRNRHGKDKVADASRGNGGPGKGKAGKGKKK